MPFRRIAVVTLAALAGCSAIAGAQQPAPTPVPTLPPGCGVTSAGVHCTQLPPGCGVTSSGLRCAPTGAVSPEAETPTPTPSATATPVVQVKTGVAAPPPPTVRTTATPARTLPFTGLDPVPIAAAGALLLCAGLALRRRLST
jgi:hypothetical protein